MKRHFLETTVIFLIGLSLFSTCEEPTQPDTTPPIVSIQSPVSGQTVNEIVKITVTTQDNEGISKVEFFIDNLLVFTDSESPYEYEWNTTTYNDTSYTVKVISYDTSDNTSESQPVLVIVDNTGSYPQATNITSITISEGGFNIVWDKSPDGDFGTYELQKSTDENMANYEVAFFTSNVNDTSYSDENVDTYVFHYYRISVSDTLGYQTIGTIYQSPINLPPVTLLEQDSIYKNHIRVHWTPSEFVELYTVYVAYDSLFTDHVYYTSTTDTMAIFSQLGDSGIPSDDGYGSKYFIKVMISEIVESNIEVYQTSIAVTRIYVPYDVDNVAQAVGYAMEGDTIFLPEGEHLTGGNSVQNSITIIGVGNPSNVVLKGGLDGSPYSPTITFHNLTIGASGYGVFAGNSQSEANVVATNVIFRELEQVAVMQTSQLEATFRNCVFYGIVDRVLDVYGNVLIENCVFTNNGDVLQINPSQGNNSGVIIRNSIFYNNYGDNIVFANFWYQPNELPTIEYSDISLDKVSGYEDTLSGIGLINADPMWVDPVNNDYHLQSYSPCIDAGNPDSQYNDADNSRNDMGAYGGTHGDW